MTLRKDALAAIKTRSILRIGRRHHCVALRDPANDLDGGQAA